jgi:hypothetical protein
LYKYLPVLSYSYLDQCIYSSCTLQAFGGDDSDVGSPRTNNAPAESSNISVDPVQTRDSNAQPIEQKSKPKKGNENSANEMDVSSVLPTGESYQSMGEILSSVDPVSPMPISGVESSAEKSAGKVAASNLNGKRSTFWGRSNVSYHLLIFFLSCINYQKPRNHMQLMILCFNLRIS